MRKGLLVIPFVGFHSGDPYNGLGPRLGALIGGFISDRGSLNADVTYEVIDTGASSSFGPKEQLLELSFSPLYHSGNGRTDFVVGPKLGSYFLWSHDSASGEDVSTLGQGWTFGVSAGFFQGSSKIKGGLLLTLQQRFELYHCDSRAGGKTCYADNDGWTVFGIQFALML